MNMVRFDPPELEQEIIEAFKIWTDVLKLDRQDLTHGEEFESAEDGEDAVTLDTSFYIDLPECESIPSIKYRDFINLAHQLRSAKLIENRECWTDHSVLIRVEPINDETAQYLYHAIPDPKTEEETQVRKQIAEYKTQAAKLKKQIDASLESRGNPDPDLVKAWSGQTSLALNLSAKLAVTGQIK